MASLAVSFVLTIMLGAVLFVEMSPPIRRPGNRIVHGTPAKPKQFPYMAYVDTEKDGGADHRYCAGSLITKDAVLTFAWCTHEHSKYIVRLGSIYHTVTDSHAWTVVSVWAVTHPEYDPHTFYNGVAIVFLPVEAPLSEYIQLVDLPSYQPTTTFVCCHGIVSGWGQTTVANLSEELRWANVVVIPNEVCSKFYTDSFVGYRSLCAGGEPTTASLWDFGAPLVLKTDEKYVQIGLFLTPTFEPPSSTGAKPGLYAKVSSYIEWIKSKTVPDFKRASGMNPARNGRRRQSSPHPQPHI